MEAQEFNFEQEPDVIHLDYSLTSPKERAALVDKIIKNAKPRQLTKMYLEKLSDYIIMAMDKDEKRGRHILTDNRLATVNKRETSFEGLVGKLENGEDGIYNMMSEDKNQFLTPKVAITQKDLEEIPELREVKTLIEQIEKAEQKATGRAKYILKRQIIELRQSQYIIKNAFRKPMYSFHSIKSDNFTDYTGTTIKVVDGQVVDDGLISLCNPKHVSALLCNYSALKQDSYCDFSHDMWYILQDLEEVTEQALADNPMYYDILTWKIDGCANVDIQKRLREKYGQTYSVEYLSALWRQKIPKIIAEKCEENYLVWYYTNIERGKWKKCNRCGEVKLAHSKFFSKNGTSKDGFYSICKCCRNKKNGQPRLIIQ